ncbi:MAG: trypsin-like peptidase domain-containing protein [Lachnospiraceae bacterium]|nr:trypsin-like peptidase domain-containing protein [Lachnospiraceae bacterium]
MNENEMNNVNSGQVTVPAPERHQTVTYVDSVNSGNRYVNNEYSQPQPAPQPVMQQSTPVPQPVVQQSAPAPQPVVQQSAPAPQPVVQQSVPAPQPVMQQNTPAPQPAVVQQRTQQTVPVQPVMQRQPMPQPVATERQFTRPEAAAAPFSNAEAMQQAGQPGPKPNPGTSSVQPSVPSGQTQYTAATNSPSSGDDEKMKKKGPNFFVKILMTAALGLVFGLVAGGVIVLLTHLFPARGGNNPGVVTSQVPSQIASEVPSENPSENPSESGVLVAGGNNEITAINVTGDMTVPEVAEECMPAIVIINTLVDYSYYGYTQEVPASGTGVIVGRNEEDLFIATNYHVVEGAKEITVQFCDASTANAVVKGKKVSSDLAVITIDINSLGAKTKEAIKLATVGDSDKLVVGESCVAIGNALGYGQSVTTGIISALDREVTTEKGYTGRFIQTDAAINPGNSGGALLNMKGELIGINSNKLGGSVVEGMGYAIPINTARPIIQTLIEKKELQELPEEQQSYFGISGATVKGGLTTNDGLPIPEGIYVTSVTPGSPADLAGIKKGDIITEFEGESVVSTQELMQYLASYPSGAEVTVTYRRLENGKFVEYDTTVTTDSKPGTGRGNP